MVRTLRIFLLASAAAGLLLQAQMPDRATPLARVRLDRLGLEVVTGEVRLPARMRGAHLRLAEGETGLERPLLLPPPGFLQSLYEREDELRRLRSEDRQAEAYRFRMDRAWATAFEAYGKAHGGRGPASAKDPDFQRLLSPAMREALAGYALVPKADLADPAAILLVEVAPRLDDGAHWVFTTRLDGRRQPIDEALLRRTGQPLRRDRMAALPAPPPGPEERVPFQILGLRRGAARSVRLELWQDDRRLGTFAFPFPEKVVEDLEPLRTWLRARCFAWSTEAPLAEGLWTAAASAYGGSDLKMDLGPETRRAFQASRGGGRPRSEEPGGPSMLALLGGRAAVDETLQLDRSLDARLGGEEVPLERLAGIDTPAHPWAEMRKGHPAPPRMPLADCVPSDRAFLYLSRPGAALASLEGGGAAFLARVNSFLGESSLDTSLVSRAMADLGLGSGLGRKLIEAGGVREAVLFAPDLALLSGTELTAVAELTPLAAAILPGAQETIQPRGPAFWARRGSRLFLSTSRAELARALALHDGKGAGSLGRSDEFAVVLGALPPGPATEAFAYLPDAFIRRLVGPRQRILQLRQSLVRQRMEQLAAAALLRRLDAPEEAADLAHLKALGYLPDGFDAEGLALAADGRVSHRDFGPLEHLLPLERVPLARVSPGEAEAYEAFKRGYSQYWRRYFDPIAFRLDAGEGGRMSLETFVLPLLDGSLYQGLRSMVAEGERARPRWALPMVAELGLRVAPQTLGEEGVLGRFLGLPGVDLHESFTGTVAVGFPDGAPIIQVGSGSPATLFDAGLLERRSDMMALGAVALGAFTRPLVLALELKDPSAFEASMRTLGWQGMPLPRLLRELEGRITREPDGRLLVRLGFFGLASMRFTARVEDRWLVLSNDASLQSPLVLGSEAPSPFPAALRLRPEALKLGLPAAFQAAMEGEARAAWSAVAWLSPWLQTGRTASAARAESQRLLGLAPLLADADVEPGTLSHRRFGTSYRPRTPAFEATADFGPLEGVRGAEVELRFEGDGLRTRVSWTR